MAQEDSYNDTDTACAAVYTTLAENARQSGLDSSTLESLAFAAQRQHMNAYPYEDQRRYALRVIDKADAMQSAIQNGALTMRQVQSAALGCNQRYLGSQSGS